MFAILLFVARATNGVEYKKLKDIGRYYGGLSGKTKSDFTNGNAYFVSYMNVFSNIEVDTSSLGMVKVDSDEKQNIIKVGDILFTASSESREESGMSSVFIQNIQDPVYLNSFCFGFRLNDTNNFLPHFNKYLFRSNFVRN